MNRFDHTAAAAHQMSRRHVLRGLGTLMSLPFLESLGGKAFAAAAAKAPATPPMRRAVGSCTTPRRRLPFSSFSVGAMRGTHSDGGRKRVAVIFKGAKMCF